MITPTTEDSSAPPVEAKNGARPALAAAASSAISAFLSDQTSLHEFARKIHELSWTIKLTDKSSGPALVEDVEEVLFDLSGELIGVSDVQPDVRGIWAKYNQQNNGTQPPRSEA